MSTVSQYIWQSLYTFDWRIAHYFLGWMFSVIECTSLGEMHTEHDVKMKTSVLSITGYVSLTRYTSPGNQLHRKVKTTFIEIDNNIRIFKSDCSTLLSLLILQWIRRYLPEPHFNALDLKNVSAPYVRKQVMRISIKVIFLTLQAISGMKNVTAKLPSHLLGIVICNVAGINPNLIFWSSIYYLFLTSYFYRWLGFCMA